MTIDWNKETAAHLYRRAAFGATSDELDAAVRDGLDAAVDRLVDYDQISNAALDNRIASMHLVLKQPNPQTVPDNVRLWLARMIYTARPLEERMTFFWHNHFATSWAKVGETQLMRDQNDLFRRNAVGNFNKMCVEVARDPAMLVWLDNETNVKDHPNENFGRELLELFTLGRGHYAESDVLAAARAFTGWTNDRTVYPIVFLYRPEWHDDGQKTFLGHTGNWNGADIVNLICAEPQHGRFIAAKVFSYFAYDNPEPEVVDRFAKIYLDAGTGLREMIRAILKSPEMYSPRAMGTRLKSPVESVVMTCHMLEIDGEIMTARQALIEQGQLLYEPPDVSGWKGGLTWVTSAALLSRFNFANTVSSVFEPLAFGIPATAEQAVDLYLDRLGPLHVDSSTRKDLIDYVAPGGVLPRGVTLRTRLRGLAHMILSLPEWQTI
jgi:uncharacterized protein (DUF1800 family)